MEQNESQDLMEQLKKDLPVTESQNRREIDLITKPKEMQKRMHQKIMEQQKAQTVKDEEQKDDGKNRSRQTTAGEKRDSTPGKGNSASKNPDEEDGEDVSISSSVRQNIMFLIIDQSFLVCVLGSNGLSLD